MAAKAAFYFCRLQSDPVEQLDMFGRQDRHPHLQRVCGSKMGKRARVRKAAFVASVVLVSACFAISDHISWETGSLDFSRVSSS